MEILSREELDLGRHLSLTMARNCVCERGSEGGRERREKREREREREERERERE